MSKEEIEKAKENTKYIIEYIDPLKGFKDFDYGDIEILLQYIDQLEQENSKEDKIIDEMANKIFEEGVVWDNKEEVQQYFEKKIRKG